MMVLAACQKQEASKVSLGKDTLQVPLEGVENTEISVTANGAWSIALDDCDWIKLSATSGEGNGSFTVTVSPLEISASSVSSRAANAVVKNGDAMATLSIVQSAGSLPDELKSGSFVIEEVFFAGVLPEGAKKGDASDGDQYIKITNTSSSTLYADHLLLCFSSYNSQVSATGSYWAPKEWPNGYIGISTMYAIPGKGTDVPVEAGASIVIAISAQDFSENGGINLSGADFEIYEDFFGLDTDNPDVTNLTCVFKASASIVMLHNRGFESYALAKLPEDITTEAYMETYPWIGEEDFYLFGEYYKTRDILAGNYLLPNDWVIDAVNLGIPADLGTLAFNSSVDAGYTGCGSIDDDPERYGKSALRKSEGGKLVDTNNSTNDFTRDATPSLK